ncbi:MAG TPA: UDP-N-acetylenolpyruvoylglucosamine reductase, partial [Pseudomonas sp.]|nr:UDP-N-acetylenolpyruvoylglucosamine reductase [Pseudomonas sp.]
MSLTIEANRSLKPFNTFAVDQRAQYFAEALSDADVYEAIARARQLGVPLLPLGGGSNLLLTRDVPALVLHMASRGKRIIDESAAQVIVEVEAGEPWHPFVLWSLEQGLMGLENLSLIPGTVGASPIQNIGAYGVEIKDVFSGLTALDIETGALRDFALADCAFAYRDSVFKQMPGRYLILRVRFALRRQAPLHLEYGPIR